MAKLTFNSEHIIVAGHKGKWYVVEDGQFKKNGEVVHAFLLEHETYGDMAACVIVDDDANLIMDDVFNGFSDLEEDGWEQVQDDEIVLGYRIEEQEEGHGIWRDFDGSWNPVFDKLTDGLCKSLPMEDSDFYRYGGKQWFSAAPSRETLKNWFSEQDAEQLQNMGYKIYEFKLANIRVVSEFEIVFTRDNIIAQSELSISDIWER